MTARWQMRCGVIAGPVFFVSVLWQGATRAHYGALRHPVSSLAIGNLGWIQSVTFIATGTLLLVFANQLRRQSAIADGFGWLPRWTGIVAVGLVGAGLFTSDPLSGYPPGTPAQPLLRTTPGLFHDLFSLLVFIGLPAACFVVARRHVAGGRGWARYSAASGAGMLAAFVASTVAFAQVEPLVSVGGLIQRAALAIGFSWLTLLAYHLAAAVPQHAERAALDTIDRRRSHPRSDGIDGPRY